MTTDTDTDVDDEEQDDVPQQLDAEAVAQLATEERRATKALVFETDRGEARYEFQMVREARLTELSETHFGQGDVRSRQGRQRPNSPEIDEDSYEKFRAEVIAEAVVEAPQGTKTSVQWIRQNVPDQWQEELFEAITDFSSMSEEGRVKFR